MHLFHATDLHNINDILKSGFSIQKSEEGSYGHPGIYFAESSQKADRYADNTKSRQNTKHLSILVVRTSLGHHANYDPVNNLLPCCDTLVGGRGKRFPEFVKCDPAQIYPEFLITYDRL